MFSKRTKEKQKKADYTKKKEPERNKNTKKGLKVIGNTTKGCDQRL